MVNQPQKQLKASVRQVGDVAVIDLRGEINGVAEDVLSTAYAEAEQSDSKVILINCAQVDYINSTGIALLVDLLTQARNAGRRLLISGLSDHYLEIFNITRLSDFVEVYPDELSVFQAYTTQ
jgi:anti-sigma B factor antagonist